MDTQSQRSQGLVRAGSFALSDELLPALVAVLLAVLATSTVVLVARRATGSLAIGAAPGWLLGWGAAAALLAALARAFWFSQAERRWPLTDGMVVAVPLAALFSTACALSSTAAPGLIVSLLWMFALVEEAATLGALGFRRRIPRGRPSSPPRSWIPRPRPPQERPRRPGEPSHDVESTAGAALLVDDKALVGQQDFRRTQSTDGRDVLRGSWLFTFLPGQTTVQVHIAFCPPFSVVPRLEYRQIAGPAARIKVGQVLPYGARLEVKRSAAAAESSRLALEIIASCDGALRDEGSHSIGDGAEQTPGKPGG